MKPLIEENWIDTGKVRFEYRHFPWIGSASKRAAHASVCAQAQGEFWAYHDHLYGPGRSARSDSALTDVAVELGLDGESFAACLADEQYGQVVEDEFRTARIDGIQATPTFVINGRRIVGAHPYEVWVQLLEAVWREL